MVSWLSAGWVGEMIYFLWGGNWVGKWELKVWDLEDVSEGGMCPRADDEVFRGPSVLDRWCVAFAVRKVGSFGQFRGPVSKRGVDSGDGRLIGRLVACICRIQTVGGQ